MSLIELLIVVAIVVVLAAVAIPAVYSMMRGANRTECLGKLRMIGVGMEGYLGDHNDYFPELEVGRELRGEDVPVLEKVLLEYVSGPGVFHCPEDRKLFEASGSSYMWNSTQSGRHKLQTSFFGTENQPERVPLVLDKESFHGEKKGTNMLYADYHISNQVEFRTDSGGNVHAGLGNPDGW